MKGRLVPLLVVVLAAGAAFSVRPASAGAATVVSRFVDDEWSVHEADVNAIAAAGITLGCNPPANDRFCPLSAVTRGEMAAFLNRAFPIPAGGDPGFADVAGSIFAGDIAAIAAAGITLGCNPPANDRYCPEAPVTREQMASFLARALQLEPTATGTFVDVSASVHARDINAIAAVGVTLGCNPPMNDRYCPGEPVTRQQMASFLTRALGLTPIHNRISLRPGGRCTKDRTYCSSTLSIPRDRTFVIQEGWFNVLPYLPGEETAFNAAATRFDLSLDGVPVELAVSSGISGGEAVRTWKVAVSGLDAGTHTFRGVWRWQGNVDLIVELTIVSA